jgi:hypothetical protein
MTHDPLYDFLLLGARVFSTFFVLGLASIIAETENDDDDDPSGGILQPCYVTSR